VRGVRDTTLVIAEMETGDTRPIDEWGCDAQWGDELHHAVHVLLTGEHEGYYADYGAVADVADQYVRPDAPRLVVCAQNHDQVGNRAFGDRLHGPKLRLAAFCAVLAPGIPLLFMGEERDERHPFLFFADHVDPEVARSTREGRRREFAAFAEFAHREVPDPGSLDTFVQSKLDGPGDREHLAYYRRLLELRRALPPGPVRVDVDEKARFLRVWRGDVQLLMNFSDAEQDGVGPWEGQVR
jgi:maltooligosyltrehalose trehalohydrolase